MIENRIVYLDAIRCIAALMVVMIHTSGCLLGAADATNIDLLVGNINSAMVRSAVPLFFMLSGALLLRSNYDLTPKKAIKKAVKIFLLMMVWNLIYALISFLSGAEVFSLAGFVYRVWKGHFHFWFFEYLLGVYLLAPLIKVIVNWKDGLYVPYYLVLWVLFGLLIPTIQAIPFANKWFVFFTNKIHLELVEFSGYFILGHYFANVLSRKIPQWGLGLCMILAMSVQFFAKDINMLWNSDAFSIFTALLGTSIFLLLKNIRYSIIAAKWLSWLSTYSLAVYIIHPMVFEHLPHTIWHWQYYAIAVVLSFCIPVVAGIFINKIPKVGKWLTSI